ncbi:MAG: HD domain-containing phosphohydrolase, partial [Pseudomonadota bacterium]
VILRRYESHVAKVNVDLGRLVDQRGEELVETREAVILGLAKLAESRDDETGEHLDRIRLYVELLARELARRQPQLDAASIETISLTSSLHDIGKVGIPDNVLLKPGPLTPEERTIMQKHPLIGGDCLMAIRRRLGYDTFLEAACEIAFAHHERWDGGGYPFGRKGEEIPLSARIVALADAYDALTTKRVYKPARSHEQARQAILEGKGTHFDPQIVEAFQRVEASFREASRQYAEDAATPEHTARVDTIPVGSN